MNEANSQHWEIKTGKDNAEWKNATLCVFDHDLKLLLFLERDILSGFKV